jgi:hypothetical protein
MPGFVPLEQVIPHFRTFATIALPGDGPLLPDAPEQPQVSMAWLPAPSSAVPPSIEVQGVEPRHRMAFRGADAAGLKSGAIIRAAGPEGGPVKTWRVDVIDQAASDEVRVLVVPVEPEFP